MAFMAITNLFISSLIIPHIKKKLFTDIWKITDF